MLKKIFSPPKLDRNKKENIEINIANQSHSDKSWLLFQLIGELTYGFDKLHHLGSAVTIFGSARLPSDHPDYLLAQEIAYLFSSNGYHIITGGGPGIMEAANRGAKLGNSKSVGINIRLPHEQRPNHYQDISLDCQYFSSRKYMLIHHAEAFIFLPGGFGTLDEVFEVLTLIQTQKLSPKLCVFVNREFWSPLLKWMSNKLVSYGTISHEDTFLYKQADTLEEVIQIFNDYQELEEEVLNLTEDDLTETDQIPTTA